MDHPNIVKLNQVFDCQNCLYMVTELCTGGELFDRIVMKVRRAVHKVDKRVSEIVEPMATVD